MGVFSDILHKIFPANHPALEAAALAMAQAGTAAMMAPAPQSQTPAAATPATATATATASPVFPSPAAAAAPTVSSPATPAAAMPPVDVEAILTEMAARNGQNLNWRSSIVDLLKLLQLNSDLTTRKELAKELHYTGDMNDSATMNIWLHKQVMAKLAQNGGKVPVELKAA